MYNSERSVSMKEWIEKYLKLLFPIDRNNIRMEEAKKEKSNHIPTKLYKYRNFNSDYHINNFIKIISKWRYVISER